MMTNLALDTFLEGKMRFEKKSRGHAGYKLPDKLGICLPGVLPLHLQHGRGEVARHILRQVQEFFGMSSDEFQTAQKCGYSFVAIYIKFVVHHLALATERARNDPLVYLPHLRAFVESIGTFVQSIS